MNAKLLTLTYLAAIVTANLTLLTFGPKAAVVNAFVLIGLDLSIRDRLHEVWQGRHLWLRMFILIGAGSAISFILNFAAWRIALASCIAFACAGLADFAIYSRLMKKKWIVKSNTSNLAGSLADSVVFPTLAFGSFMPWISAGQFAAKALGGLIWSILLKKT